MRFLSLLAILTLVPVALAEDLKPFHDGVKAIHFTGSPGDLVIFGDKAFPIVVDASPAQAPVVAAGQLGQGRVVAFGHDSFFNPVSLKNGDSKTFLLNVVKWASGNAEKPRIVTLGYANTAKFLTEAGLPAEEAAFPKYEKGVVLIATTSRLPDAKKLQEFIEAGGGLIVGTPGWGWQQVNPGKSLANDLPVNQVLAAAGLTFGPGFVDTAKQGGQFAVGPCSAFTNSGLAVTAVEKWLHKGDAPAAGEAEVIRAAVNRLSNSVPASVADPLRARLAKAISGAEGKIAIPSAKKPLSAKDPNDRLLLGITNQLAMELPTDAVKAHPAAAGFPGSVPADAKRVTKTVEFTVDPTGFICNGVGVSANSDIWHSTGLYAAPGETITLTLPDNVLKEGFGVQIGAHTDTLWHLKSWQRAPQITKKTKVTQAKTTIANPFGGLVYITAPVKSKIGKVEATISGAVETPRFVLGQTTAEQWKTIRMAPGPWAEFESGKIILVVPSDSARKVENPQEVLEFWDKVQDNNADLTAVDRKRGRAERLVHDVQISAGYMHSGYPIMAPLGEINKLLDVARIQREGAWGYFHELGHNHQQKEWTFDGTTEVTCNLYSLFNYAQLCPQSPLHDAMRPDAIKRHAAKYLAEPKFETWKSDPFVALILFHQWEQSFGWVTFKKVFAEYQKLTPKEKPKNDLEERDQLLIRMSKATGKNLTKHLDFWGVPTSDAAKKQVADLPDWDFPDPRK